MQAAASAAVLTPPVAASFLLQRLQLPTASVGMFVALIYLAATFASPLGAQWVRRFGPIRSSQLALVVISLGLALVAIPSTPLTMLGALLIGAGYGPITPASSQMLSRTTPLEHYALVFSIKQTGVPLGGVIAGLMIPPLLVAGGAVAAMLGTSALCLLAAASAVPLRQALDASRVRDSPWMNLQSLIAPARFVFDHPVLRRLAASTTVLSIVQISFTAYLVTFLIQDWRWSLLQAGAALSAAQVAGVIGRIGWGMLSDRWLGARRTLFVLSLVMALCGIGMAVIDSSMPVLPIVLLCVYGATAVGWNGVYLATVARVVTQAQAATATAGSLMFTFLGVVVGPPIFGLIGQWSGSLALAYTLLAVPLTGVLWVMRRGVWA